MRLISRYAVTTLSLTAMAPFAEQTIVQHKLVVALRNYARLANLQYDGGYVPYSTVLQADQQLFPAELNLAATRAAMAATPPG